MNPAPMTPTLMVLMIGRSSTSVVWRGSLRRLLHLGGQALVVDGLPTGGQAVGRDRQRGHRDVGRRLLVQQAIPGQTRLGDALVERALRAQALDRTALGHVD